MGSFAGPCGGNQTRLRLYELVVGVSKLYNMGNVAIHDSRVILLDLFGFRLPSIQTFVEHLLPLGFDVV